MKNFRVILALSAVTAFSTSAMAQPAREQDNIYTSYPAFGDENIYGYKDKRVNVVIQKGLVRELIVQCTKEREGIMVHDHISDMFCDSKNVCHKTLKRAIDATCG